MVDHKLKKSEILMIFSYEDKSVSQDSRNLRSFTTRVKMNNFISEFLNNDAIRFGNDELKKGTPIYDQET